MCDVEVTDMVTFWIFFKWSVLLSIFAQEEKVQKLVVINFCMFGGMPKWTRTGAKSTYIYMIE